MKQTCLNLLPNNLFIFFKQLFCCCLLWSLFLPASKAQDTEEYMYVYPIRVDHKWGYVKIFPTYIDTVTAPRYDYLGDINLPYNTPNYNGEPSPYKLFDLADQVGLLNENLEEVLPNAYQQIQIVADDLFAVSQEEDFILIDQQGKVYLDSMSFENICLAAGGNGKETSYLFTKKNGFWGLHSIPNNVSVIPHIYTKLESAGYPGYYKVKKQWDQDWILIDTTNRQVFPEPFDNVLVLNEKRFAIYRDKQWQIYTKNGPQFEKEKRPYSKIRKLNKHLLLLEQFTNNGKKKVVLKNIERDSVLDIYTDTSLTKDNFCLPLDENYALKDGKNGRYIVNKVGRKISRSYLKIAATKRKNIYVGKAGFTQSLLYQIKADSFSNLETMYDTIYPIRDNISVCRTNQTFGLIGFAKDTIVTLPCVYESMPQIDSNQILLQFEEDVISYRFSPEKYFVPDTIIYEQSQLMASSREQKKREAIPIKFERYSRYYPSEYYIYKGILYVKKFIPNQNGDLRAKDTKISAINKKHLPRPYCEILPNLYAIGYHSNKLRLNKGDYLSFLTQKGCSPIQFVKLTSGHTVNTPIMVGVRPFNRGVSVSAFIAPTGQMGLVNQAGQEIKKNGAAIRYTFIGPFIDGKARACRGGQLEIDISKKLAVPPKFSMGTTAQLLNDFRILPNKKLPFIHQSLEYFITSTPDNPTQWSYIDTTGTEIIQTEYDHVADFHWKSKTALVLNATDKEVYAGTGKKAAIFGVIDQTGQTVIPPTYNSIVTYKDFYLVNKANTPTFTFNQKGVEILINSTKPGTFSNGLAPLRNAQNLLGFIDEDGRPIIPTKYKETRAFSDGLALVKDSKDHYQFIDTTGRIAFRLKTKSKVTISDFQEGKSWKKLSGKSWVWQCIDKKGKPVFDKKYFFEPTYKDTKGINYLVPMSFSNGLASVLMADSMTNQLVSAIIDTTGTPIKIFSKRLAIDFFNKEGIAFYKDKHKGLINSKGTKIIPAIYKDLAPLKEGLLKAQNQKGKWGIINYEGAIILPFNNIAIGTFSEGLVALKKEQKEGNFWVYADLNGGIVITGPFTEVSAFENGHALVKKKNLQAETAGDEPSLIINRQGEAVQFNGGKATLFSEGLFCATQDSTGHQYYANAAGLNVFGRFFQEIIPFQLGIATVKRLPTQGGKKELYGAINKRGVMVVPPKFRYLHIQPTGTITINPQRYFGLLDKAGNVLLAPVYDKIDRFEKFNIFRVERGESIGYVRLVEEQCIWVWELQK